MDKLKENNSFNNQFFEEICKYKELLKNAVKKHFPELESKEGKVYAYSLYSTNDADHIFPVANRECDVKDEELRYSVDDYALYDDTDYFNEVSELMGNIKVLYSEYYDNDYDRQQQEFPDLIKVMGENNITHSYFEDARDCLFLGALQVLYALKKEGFFRDDIYLSVWPCDCSSKIIEESIKLLNNEEIVESCSEFFDS